MNTKEVEVIEEKEVGTMTEAIAEAEKVVETGEIIAKKGPTVGINLMALVGSVRIMATRLQIVDQMWCML